MMRTHARVHPRVKVTLSASVKTARSEWIAATVVDMGLGGVALELDAVLRINEAVEVVLLTTPAQRFEGTVAWLSWSDGGKVRCGIRAAAPHLAAVDEVSKQFWRRPRVS